MLNPRKGNITSIPVSLSVDNRKEINEDINNKRNITSVLESVYWQTIGWVHTPPFQKVDLDSNLTTKPLKSEAENNLATKKSLDPKLQIEDKVPYGALPKDVVVDIEKRRFSQQDLKSILEEMDIRKETIIPLTIVYKDKLEIIRKECLEGIPQEPFLELDLFDDSSYYDAYSPEEWLSLGDTESGRESLSALAFIPEQESNFNEPSNFDWLPVLVLNYDSEKKLYLVRKIVNLHDEREPDDVWIPRIYLKFDAEEPFHFAKRLQTAVLTRHIVEESLRMSYYVECMPLDGAPEWSRSELDAIYAKVRRSRQLQPKLQWIKDHWKKIIEEIVLEYKRAFNYLSYVEIAKQVPCLVKTFKNKPLSFYVIHHSGSKVQLNFPFEDRFESFRCNTLYTGVEVVRALTLVQTNIEILQNMSLYNLPLDDIYALEKFELLQKTQLQTVSKYIREKWLLDISNAILLNLENCGKGSYDLNQTALHTFQLTKLGKLLKMVIYKMQDVIRFLVVESVEKYSTAIQAACASVLSVKDNFKWEGGLSSDKLSPPGGSIFEVPLEIKGDHLKFGIDINRYKNMVRDLFEEGLKVTKDLPRLEKFVMKKMLYNPDDKLETVGEKEKQIVAWKMDIIQGMDRAIIAANAYIRAYDEPLKPLKTNQINYIKQFKSKKANCDQLKQVIEMHHNEKTKLENSIPSFIDIGPFRLMTKTVRNAAIKKHEQLADAVLDHFYDKLRDFMKYIQDDFLILHERIRQPTGNIEDLLDKKQWCRTVPKKIERSSEEVNRLRADFHLISTFHRNMDDEDFITFWQIQAFPQISMKMLESRISTFDTERNEHKDHLILDIEQLQLHLNQLQEEVMSFTEQSDAQQAPAIATEIRKTRKNILKCEEQAQLYQKRQRLLGLPLTEYPEIVEISDLLVPFENFWLSTADFQNYKARDLSDIQSMDSAQLKEAIQSFHTNLQAALPYFEDSFPDIHKAIISVIQEVEEFTSSTLSQIS